MLSMGTGAASMVVTASAEKAAVALRAASASKETKPNLVDLISAPVWFLSRSYINRSYDNREKKR